MSQLDWMQLWDSLRAELESGQTSYGKNQVIALMEKLEREMVRSREHANAEG